MPPLSLDQRTDECAERTACGDTLMLGTSAGIRGVHDPRALPLDTVTYLLRADAARRRMGDAQGLFFAFDKRLDGDSSDQPAIDHRTQRLRQLLSTLLPHFAMTTQSALEERGLQDTLARVEPCAAIDNEELRHYTRMQTAQVLHMRAEARNGSAHRFAKFGWILSRRGNGTPVGGEANFDALLPDDLPIERIYTAPAFPLDSTNGKAPYLLNESDRAVRVCIPHNASEIGAEVEKVQSGISRIVHDTLRATAATVLGLQSEIHAPDDALCTLPLSKPMKERITDERQLAKLRELLCAALHHLLS